MGSTTSYKARQFNLSNLKGISDETLEMHFKLYEGYVKETNKLNEKIAEFVKGGKVDQDEFAEYSELNRRLAAARRQKAGQRPRKFRMQPARKLCSSPPIWARSKIAGPSSRRLTPNSAASTCW